MACCPSFTKTCFESEDNLNIVYCACFGLLIYLALYKISILRLFIGFLNSEIENHMKLFGFVIVSLVLTGCASDEPGQMPNSVRNRVISGVANRCHAELDKNARWQQWSVLLKQYQKDRLEEKVCACAGEESANHVSINEIRAARSDESVRPEIIERVATDAIMVCLQRIKL